MRHLTIVILALFSTLALSFGAASATPAWLHTVTLSADGGHVLGNPRAVRKIVEYASYTCPHCAHFEAEGAPPLKRNYVASGTTSFEVRNLIRDRYDLAAALVARCGGPARFFGNHQAIFAWQSQWLTRVEAYESGPELAEGSSQVAILQDIADKTGLAALMQRRGFNRPQIKACIADPRALAIVLAMRQKAINELDINGTPSFLVDGHLTDAHDWDSLRALLRDGLPVRSI